MTVIGETVWDEGLIRDCLPEVELINDGELRYKTIDALQRAVPRYFWRVPATTSGRYHNPFARNKHGLWIHTKACLTAYERMVDSYVEQQLITETEADYGRAALLLHDILKYGHEYSEGDSTNYNSDVVTAEWLSYNTDLPSNVIGAVKAHCGPFAKGPAPSNPLEQLVHMADMIGSTKNVTVGLYKPSQKIHQRYPSVPRAEL